MYCVFGQLSLQSAFTDLPEPEMVFLTVSEHAELESLLMIFVGKLKKGYVFQNFFCFGY